MDKETCIRSASPDLSEYETGAHIPDSQGECMICGMSGLPVPYRMDWRAKLWTILVAILIGSGIVLFQWIFGGLGSH